MTQGEQVKRLRIGDEVALQRRYQVKRRAHRPVIEDGRQFWFRHRHHACSIAARQVKRVGLQAPCQRGEVGSWVGTKRAMPSRPT
jgi:hypothetical protein